MNDLISRQMAIEVVNAVWTVTKDKNVAKVWQQLKDLPPAQSKIIRCKDCKFSIPDWTHQNNSDCYCSNEESDEYGLHLRVREMGR